ncbi:MAG TPA: AraC family transcriptional regulator [Candidatus Fimimorpha excrementavium]|nr:AraC family transcriptional regulator [Candidatus Fimimorpha excrementavium]
MADKSFRRQEFSSLVAAGHALSRKASNPDFHIHNNYEIYIFLQGHVNYFVEQSCYQLKRGDILIFNNQEIHTVVNLKNEVYERITIHFEPKWIRNLSTSQTDLLACFQNRPKGVGNLSHMEDEELATWLPIIEQLISCSNDPSYGSDLLTQSYLVQLLVFVNQLYHNSAQSSSGSIPVKVQPVLHYVDRHISEALTLDGIAEALSMDKFYLSHLFKKETGSTLFQYIVVKRVTLAKSLLSRGYSVSETCEIAGFNDYSNFIRTFKKITGFPPGQYKKQSRIPR